MQVDGIEFIQTDEGAQPGKIKLTVDIKEAIWICKLAGTQRGISPHLGIYDVLTRDVFNSYWEDGLNEAFKEFPVEIPPIKYEKD